MPKAYSYIRFSTPEQAKGDSFRRQTEASRKYAEDHGLVLDTSLNLFDQGLSGYTGENRTKGALSVFIRAVETGLVPKGSVLLVESLDRLSRDKIMEQIALITSLINAGITVVTLINGQVLSKETLEKDPMQLMISIIYMSRAHDESKHKSLRVREAWAAKRKRAGAEKLSAKCPFWMRLTPDRQRFELIPERVALVERIYQMSAQGLGQMSIARTLNEENVPTWSRGKGWHFSYIQRILRSRAVLGEYQPRVGQEGKQVPDGPPIVGYYPPVIALELWQRLNSGRPAVRTGGPLGPRVNCLFSGLIYDGYTGTSMRHISRRAGKSQRRQRPRYYYLVSDYGRMGKTALKQATSWRYEWFEALFLAYITRLDWAAVAQEAAPQEEAQARTRLAEQHAKLEAVQRQLARLTEALATTEQTAPKTVLEKIAQLEKEATAAEETLLAIGQEAVGYEARRLALQDSGEQIRALATSGDVTSRLRLREEMRRKITRIDVFAEGVPADKMTAEELPLSAPGWPAFKITFANETIRWVFNRTKRPDPDADAATVDTNLPDEEVPCIGDDEPVLDADEVLEATERGLPLPPPISGRELKQREAAKATLAEGAQQQEFFSSPAPRP